MELPPGITLTLDRGGETGLYADLRCSFTMGIPGHPTLHPPAPTAGQSEPAYDSLVVLADLPVALRFRLNSLPEDPAPTFAPGLVRTFALNRCRAQFPLTVHAAAPEQCQRFGVDAAASCAYPLAASDDQGSDSEEALVLLRHRQIMLITKRFDSRRTPAVAWSLFSAAAAAALVWGDTSPACAVPALWPHSDYLLPGVTGQLRAELTTTAEHLRAVLDLPPEPKQLLTDRLKKFLHGSDLPGTLVSSDERRMYLYALTRDIASEAQELALEAAMSPIRTIHDLRGFAILVLHALGQVPATFATAEAVTPGSSPVELYSG